MIQHKPELSSSPPKKQCERYCACVRPASQLQCSRWDADKECSLCVEYLTASTKVWQLNSQCVSNDWVRDELEIIISDNSPFIETRGVSARVAALQYHAALSIDRTLKCTAKTTHRQRTTRRKCCELKLPKSNW